MSLDWILLGLRLLATLILYTFLGLAFYIIWRDLKQLETTSQPQATFQLRVIAAPEDKSLVVGETLPLQPITILENDVENTIVLRDGPVSTTQARLHRENGVWWLEDLSSGQGTVLNELPLSKPTPLNEGDIIGIGNLRLRLESSR